MRYLGYAFIAIGLLVILYGIFGGRLKKPTVSTPLASDDSGSVVAAEGPTVSDFHVVGKEAQVSFDVELPEDGADDVLREWLMDAALEAVAEKKASLPIDAVSSVSALVGGVVIGSTDLETPEEIDARMLVDLKGVEGAPLASHGVEVPNAPGGLSAPATGGADELKKLSDDLSIPASVDAALRASGLDPASADAPELVRGVLAHKGYTVGEMSAGGYLCSKAGRTIYVHNVGHSADAHPELSDGDIRSFVAAAASSPADEAILVTAKFCPFSVYAREKANPAIRFISRERLQEFITQITLS